MKQEIVFSALKNHLDVLWNEQIQKDLKGKLFEETLQSDYEGIKINPLYTKDQLPTKEIQDSEIFSEAFEEAFKENTEEEGGKILTWNICEQIQYKENDLNQQVLESVKRGCNFLSVQTKNWSPFFKELRSLQYPASFSLQIESDLTEENIVAFWRENIGYIGSRDLLIHALEFDPISYWMIHGIAENENKTWNHFAQLYFRIAGHLQDCKLLKIDATHFAQNDITDQLAFALAITSEYFHQLQTKEIILEELIHLTTFKFCVSTNYFLEIAKLQAFRILWCNLLKAYLPDLDYVPNPYLHIITTTQLFPDEKKFETLIHQTSQAMSAVLGGCDTLQIATSNSEFPTIKNAATHIQNILRYESNFDSYKNAADGSFYLESLTTQIAEIAWNKFQQIENDGGFLLQLRENKINMHTN